MMVFWSFVWIGVLGVIVWAVAEWARGGSQRQRSDATPAAKTARALLDERLARGDIDVTEYQTRRAALEIPNAASEP